jgi:hypothetical protein
MNIELMKHVETIVRPIHAPTSRKLRMREELYSQLEQILLEESANQDDPQAASMAACERFGNAGELRKELQATVPAIIATTARMDQWIGGRRPGEPLLRFAARIGVRFGAIIAVTVTVLLLLANPGGGQSPPPSIAWSIIAAAGVLFGLNTFVITLCGNAVMAAIEWKNGRMRIRRKEQAALCVLAVGLMVGFSEVAVWLGTDSGYSLAAAAILFLEVSLFSVVTFSAVVGLMAYDQRGLREWNELELSAE